ncbi:MAG: hypothetical protein NE330_22030 [Lentisphaeraceae bacterium]|nr:hypothetical protein [Lentisphaeraceae bacterium]
MSEQVMDEGVNVLLDEDSLLGIQEEYRKKKLIESLIGPTVSTVFHVALIIVLALLLTDQYKDEVSEVEVQLIEEEEITIEEPPIEEPEPVEVVETDQTNPVVTTVEIENVETNEDALENVDDNEPSTDDDSVIESVSDVEVSPSAFVSPTIVGGRSASGRAASSKKFGASKLGQSKLLKALFWLKKVQNPDGSWGTQVPDAFTSLALLTFLAHGETNLSKEFGLTVKKAMEWLVNSPLNAQEAHGYPHAIKAYAVSEAYAMIGNSLLEEKMNESIQVIVDGIQDGGAFDYNYKKTTKQDLSFSGWNYQALKAAYGAGCEVSGLEEAIAKSIRFLKASTSDGHVFTYSIENNVPNKAPRASHTMRGVGVLCLQLFGEGKYKELDNDLENISNFDLAKLDWNNPPSQSLYGWYYATQAMFQEGGKSWRTWNKKFQKVLTDNQHDEGYWEYPGEYYGSDTGDHITKKVHATTLCALMLTVYYRYLPTTKPVLVKKKEAKLDEKKEAKDLEEELDLIEGVE